MENFHPFLNFFPFSIQLSQIITIYAIETLAESPERAESWGTYTY